MVIMAGGGVIGQMYSDYKTIFILGAGFSKSFCPTIPTMKDLTDLLFDKPSALPNDEYQELRRFAQECYEKSNYSGELKNIEKLTTLIFSKVIFSSPEEEQKYHKFKHQLLKFIYQEIGFRKYGEIRKADESSKDTLAKFVRFCGEGFNNEDKEKRLVISFNYDLLLEYAFCQAYKDQSGPIFYGVDLNSYVPRRMTWGGEKRLFELLKLHGSFNWFRAKGATGNDISSVYKVDEFELGMHKVDVPLFIPMGHNKELFLNGSLYNTFWAKAIHYLDNAQEIVFIGYGFPDTDINNLVLFLDYKDKITHIVVHPEEKTREKELKRLQNIFPDQLVKDCDAKKYLEETWLDKSNQPNKT